MSYVFGVGLLLVTAAVVVLFAMFGELYARIGGAGGNSGGYMRVLPDARVGHVTGSWPAGLAGLGSAELGVLLVLSTACGTCDEVARQLSARPRDERLRELAVVVSTGDARRAEEFLAGHALSELAHHVDIGGAWVSGEFGVRTSPTALVFRRGQLVSALAFSDLPTLRASVMPVGEPA